MKQLLRWAYRVLPMKRCIMTPFRGKLPYRVYQHLPVKGPFTIAIDGVHSFQMWNYGEFIENQLYWSGIGGDFEGVSLKLWAALAAGAPGAIIDIGANNGVYSLAARSVNRGVRVIAFEPSNKARPRLRRNIDLNGFRVEVERKAASDRAGTAALHSDLDSPNYGASLEPSRPGNSASYPIETIRLDDWLSAQGWPEVSLVKIDVEEHEPAVIRGMDETIRRFRPAILIEVLRDEIGAAIMSALPDVGYEIWNIDERSGLTRFDRLRSLGGENWNNLLCTQDQFNAITPPPP